MYARRMERNTRQRRAIQEAFAAEQRPLSPQEVLQAARGAVPGLGIATVYRTLKALIEEGLLKPVALPDENPRYELAGDRHHHHFQCRRCRRVFDVHACPGDLSNLAPTGFVVDDHELTLYGYCSDCATRQHAAVPGTGRHVAKRRPAAQTAGSARRPRG